MKPNSISLIRRGFQFFLLLGLVATCNAQYMSTNAPRTYFEAFASNPNVLLAKGMSIIGSLNGQIGFPVEVRAEEIRTFRSTNVLYAVAIHTTYAQHQSQTDYIDYDELSGLINAVQSIKQADRSVAQLENFDVVFQTRSGFTVAKTSRGNRITVYLKSGDPYAQRNLMDPSLLDTLAMYLSSAKTKLDLLKQSP